jgi:hypothetical protein
MAADGQAENRKTLISAFLPAISRPTGQGSCKYIIGNQLFPSWSAKFRSPAFCSFMPRKRRVGKEDACLTS